MEPKNNKATGSMKISEEVVATIVKSVLSEIEGVHSLATRPVAPSEMLMKNTSLKPITIYLSADVAAIDICVNLCFGVKLLSLIHISASAGFRPGRKLRKARLSRRV